MKLDSTLMVIAGKLAIALAIKMAYKTSKLLLLRKTNSLSDAEANLVSLRLICQQMEEISFYTAFFTGVRCAILVQGKYKIRKILKFLQRLKSFQI